MSLRYLKSEKLILWWPEDRLDYDLVIDYFKALARCPWGEQANRYCDFSRLTEIQLSYEDVRRLAEYRMSLLQNHIRLKICVYSTADLGYAFGRMYQSVTELAPLDVAVFRELSQAAAWLEVPVDYLTKPP